MFRWLIRRYKQRLRTIDHETLFVSMRAVARDRDHFLDAAHLHLVSDHAWNVDYGELDERDRRLWDQVYPPVEYARGDSVSQGS